MTAKLTPLPLGGLPSFREATPIWCRLSHATEAALAALPDTFARAVGALHFCQYMGSRESEKAGLGASYLRAALMEYVGMEETLKIELPSRGISDAPLTIKETGNALLIVMRELRNLQIHLVSTRFKSGTRPYAEKPSGPIVGELPARFIPRTDLDQLTRTNNAKYYDPYELASAIQWLDDAQDCWGINDVVLATIQMYADAIVSRHRL